MATRTLANLKKTSKTEGAAKYGKTRLARGGFSLVELVIVMVIMVIVIGVAASLLYGMISMHEVASDQTSARRRAQDVFNILQVALQNAGIGVPAGEFDYYFGSASPTSSFLANWDSPVTVTVSGDVLKVVYSLPTGLKYERIEGTFRADPIDEFSDINPPGATYTKTLEFVGKSFDIVADETNPAGIIKKGPLPNTRSFVTFPGMEMHPLVVTVATPGTKELTLTLSGITPKEKDIEKVLGILPRNVIYPYADLYALKAAVAFVDDRGGKPTFYMLDGFEDDPFDGNKLPDNVDDFSGFRVEGIKAIRFLPGVDKRQMTVWVLAEGELAGSSVNSKSKARQAIDIIRGREYTKADKSKEKLWEDVAFEDDVYYEDFFMTWRMRNLQIEN